MKTTRTVQLTLCGPGDVATEIDLAKKVIHKWNEQNFDLLNCGIRARHSLSDATPSMRARGQEVINWDVPPSVQKAVFDEKAIGQGFPAMRIDIIPLTPRHQHPANNRYLMTIHFFRHAKLAIFQNSESFLRVELVFIRRANIDLNPRLTLDHAIALIF